MHTVHKDPGFNKIGHLTVLNDGAVNAYETPMNWVKDWQLFADRKITMDLICLEGPTLGDKQREAMGVMSNAEGVNVQNTGL